MDAFNLIVAGSRTFNDYGLMKDVVRQFMTLLAGHKGERKTSIVSGGAKGADALGERLAVQYGLKTIVMKANWDRDGKGAGYQRNERMSEMANACVVFCCENSKGSTHMRELSMKAGIPTAFVAIDSLGDFLVTYMNMAM